MFVWIFALLGAVRYLPTLNPMQIIVDTWKNYPELGSALPCRHDHVFALDRRSGF